MNRRPPEPLDAEERALLARLPRAGGRGEPGAGVDARILAMAREASEGTPSKPRPRRRRNWAVPVSVAATVTIAVGLAWRLQPPPSTSADARALPAIAAESVHAPNPTMPPASPAAQVAPVEPSHDEAPPMVARERVSAPDAMTALPPPRSRDEADDARMTVPSAEPAPARKPANAAGETATADAPARMQSPAPPPPPPVAAAPTVLDTLPAAPPIAVPEPAPAAQAPKTPAQARATGASLDRITVSGTRIGEERERAASPVDAGNEAERAAKAAPQAFRLETFEEDDVPPATMDSPAARDAWLRRIHELVDQGREEEARASLAEFQKRHPSAPIPAKLRALQASEDLPEPPAD